MRRGVGSSLVVLSLAVVMVATLGGVGAASTSAVNSLPNGDIRLLVSVGCGSTNRDHDGDFNTCGKGDTASLLYSVFNQSDVTQTIQIDAALDGPGTAFDEVTSQQVVIEPRGIHDEFAEMRVQNKMTPLGQYTLSVTAGGSESAATSASLTVHRGHRYPCASFQGPEATGFNEVSLELIGNRPRPAPTA